MAELRWILLAAGIALILGLWWWETRKARARPNEAAVEPWPAEGSEQAVMEVGEGDAEVQEFEAEPRHCCPNGGPEPNRPRFGPARTAVSGRSSSPGGCLLAKCARYTFKATCT